MASLKSNHPLIELLAHYCETYRINRSDNADLSNLDFHKRFGLYLNGPMDWPYVEAIKYLVDNKLASSAHATIIYSSTDFYRKIYKGIGRDDDQRISYLSFSDIFFAIHREQDLLVSIKNRLKNSSLVICAGTSMAADEVITQIHGFCDGCLVVLG